MRRIPEFDSVRGVAALAIVIHHVWFPSFSPMATALNLFFVVSGFLITGIVLRNLDEERFFQVFYLRRALRIWPIYYLALFAVVAINLLSPVRESMEGLPYFLAHLQKIQCYWLRPESRFIASFLHTWTLAIEEQFYLLWPLLLFVAGRKAVGPLALVLIAIPVLARVAGFNQWLLLTQSDGLAMGGLLAGLLYHRPWAERHRGGLHAALIALCVVAAVFTVAGAPALARQDGIWKPIAASLKILFTNAFYLGVVGLIVGFSGHPALGPLRNTMLCYLGTISYGLYLYHYIILKTAERFLDQHGVLKSWWMDVLVLVSSIALASLSWHFVERPILAWKDRIHYRPRAVPSVPGERPSTMTEHPPELSPA